MWFLWDESWRRSFSNRLHRFRKQFPKQNDFGWLSAYEIAGSFQLWWSQPKMETTETSDIMWLLSAMRLYIFLAESTSWDPSPLDACNQEKTFINGRDIPCRRFYYIDCCTTSFPVIPPIRSKLNDFLCSIIRGLIH